MKTTYSTWPKISDDEIKCAVNVLKSGKINYWTGEQVKQFETEFARYCGVKYALAVANGTLALELCLRVLGIGQGDEVIVTPNSFIASASCIVERGAKPIFADIDASSQNITPKSILKVITPKTKAIIAVHISGWPCEMEQIMGIAEKHQLFVIEDCAQAHGAQIHKKPVGSFGHLAAFSFCQDKIMTTGGEGGMVVTNNQKFWKKAWAFKDHGKDYDVINNKDSPSGVFRWLHTSFGSNYRMTEIQAAIGREQLKKLPNWLATRKKHAAIYSNYLNQCSFIKHPRPPQYVNHSYYKYYFHFDPNAMKPGWSKEKLISTINLSGGLCFSGSSTEMYREKAFEVNNLHPSLRLPVAKRLGATSLMFVLHPTLTENEIHKIAEITVKVFTSAFSRV